LAQGCGKKKGKGKIGGKKGGGGGKRNSWMEFGGRVGEGFSICRNFFACPQQ